MSHFTVLVIGPNHEEQLAPFTEQEGTESAQYFVFNDCTAQLQKKYDEEDAETRAKYPTLKEYAEEYHGYDEVDGKYGYRTNPNAKWDWYSVGGRWRGFFKVKKGVQYKESEPHWGETMNGESPRDCAGRTDECLKGEVDIEGMRDEAQKKAEDSFDRYAAVVTQYQGLADHIPTFSEWAVLQSRPVAVIGRRFDMEADVPAAVLQLPVTKEETDAIFKGLGRARINELRESYRALPVIKALNADPDLLWVNDYNEEFNRGDRAAYIASCRAGAISTFAVVKDGVWYERGEMGWWGCVSNEKDEGEWQTEFAKLLDGLPDDTPLTLVDCHI